MTSKVIKAVQLAKNKLLRLLAGSQIKDMLSKKDMLNKFEILSMNQTLAQIKLTEAWKASRNTNYPINMKNKKETLGGEISRQLRKTTFREM